MSKQETRYSRLKSDLDSLYDDAPKGEGNFFRIKTGGRFAVWIQVGVKNHSLERGFAPKDYELRRQRPLARNARRWLGQKGLEEK